MDIRVGTSGWSFYDKDNLFFPKKIKASDKLSFFAESLNAVEVNTSFYHFPRKTTIEKWKNAVDKDFRFIIKLNRLFTHEKKLNLDKESVKRLNEFMVLVNGLEENLGGYLIQLPASLKCDLGLLENFLQAINKYKADNNYKIFLEVRDESWIRDSFFTVLKDHKTTLVYNDSPRKWPEVLMEETDSFYFRLHGREKLYYSTYTKEELEGFLEILKNKDFNMGYFFFNNTAGSGGIENALYLKELIKCDII